MDALSCWKSLFIQKLFYLRDLVALDMLKGEGKRSNIVMNKIIKIKKWHVINNLQYVYMSMHIDSYVVHMYAQICGNFNEFSYS